MIINETTTPVWQELALDHPGIAKFVMPELVVRNFREDSYQPVETSGFLTGILQGDTFYILANNPLCWGKAKPFGGREYRTVALEPEERGPWWVFLEEVNRRFALREQQARTVIWHTHCRTTVATLQEMWPDEATAYIEVLQEEMQEGHFDHLGFNGARPSLDDVVNDVISRQLSEADISLTPGNTHLLITETWREQSPLSHLNAFKLVPGSKAYGKISIETISQQPPKTIRWYEEAVRSFEAAHTETCERHEDLTRLHEDMIRPEFRLPGQVFFMNA
ncbi:MAG: hypothetical protein RL094_373 [Candidatus Parcubacteria bacterium]|jgi:hypothetical protein